MKKIPRFSFHLMAKLAYLTYGLDVFARHKWLLSTFTWSPQERMEWRLKQLGEILEFAWNHVPFYREYWGDHGVQFRMPKEIDDLQRYPVLTKDIFRLNSSRIQPDNLESIRYRKWSTGGTTGQPVKYLRDMQQWGLNEAFHMWGWSQAGYVFGDPVGVIAGGSLVPEKKTLEARLRGWIHRRMLLYGVAMDRSLAREYHGKLLKHKVKILYGYPSILYLFGWNLEESGLSLPGLKAVITTAEMLLPQYREGIERSFGCKVFDNLGCNDGGYEAYECHQHNGFHYNDLQSILEADSPDSTIEGRLLITNLWNKSTPFIRYENGDLVKIENQTCVCNCPFPLISSIRGRTTDILTFGNGRSLAGPALTLIFREMEIDGWQVVQTGLNRLEVRVCSRERLRPDYADHIYSVLRHYLAEEVTIEIKHVKKLETTKGGKWKPVWKEIGTENDNVR